MKDLGDYSINWSESSYGLSSLTNDLDYDTSDKALYTSGGYIQFYPNPNDVSLYSNDSGGPYGVENPSIGLYSVNSFLENAQGYKYFLAPYIGQPENSSLFSSITYGGMCVRAVNDSIINIQNVNFPCGWWNPSSIVYDAVGNISDPLCERLFLFNIADNSQITAKYVSVSSLHPADVAYFGPRGTWDNASAAPSATPDTGTISILDFYGPASGHPWAKTFHENKGPFRLYFSTDPACNWLTLPNGTRSGYASQVFSQGYNFSSTLTASGNLSAVYTSLVGSNGSASGFYYAKDMIAGKDSLKAILDDSAANTFANAKHCSVGKSNIPKLVSILYPHKGSYGGDSADSEFKEYGKGLRSVNTFDLEGDN
jgi:hypothetical protein